MLPLRRCCLLTAIVAASLTSASCQKKADIADARRHVEDYAISAVSFRAMDEFFPVDIVDAEPGEPLPTSPQSLSFDVALSGKTMSFDDALQHTDTNAILVIKDGEVIYERYFNGANEKSRFISWSMAKSITSILVGKAVESGAIENLDDPIEKYVTQLKGTPFEGVSLRQLLNMRAGTDYKEAGLFGSSDVDTLAEQSLFTNKKPFTDITALGLERKTAPGDAFNYSTLNSSLLSQAVEVASGQSLADFMSEQVWKPAGMQYSGYWMLDAPDGAAFGGGGYNATLRDYGRLGLMMLQGGQINGAQVIPEDWVRMSTAYDSPEPVIPKSPRGYAYSWWTFVGTEIYEAVGIHGQFISVDPETNTVIVKLSHWPKRGGRNFAVENHALFTAIRKEISGE